MIAEHEITLNVCGVERDYLAVIEYDAAPAEPSVNYPGEFHFYTAKVGNMDIAPLLTPDQIEAIGRDLAPKAFAA